MTSLQLYIFAGAFGFGFGLLAGVLGMRSVTRRPTARTTKPSKNERVRRWPSPQNDPHL